MTLVDYLRFSNILETSMDEFVDFETGKTNFSNDLFRRFCRRITKNTVTSTGISSRTKAADATISTRISRAES